MDRFFKKYLSPWLLDFDSDTVSTSLLRKKEITLNRLRINIETLEANVDLPPYVRVHSIWLSGARLKIRSLARAAVNVINTMPFHAYIGTVSIDLQIDLARTREAAVPKATEPSKGDGAQRFGPDTVAAIVKGILAGLAVEVSEIDLKVRVVDSSSSTPLAPAGPTLQLSLIQLEFTQYRTSKGGHAGWARVGSEASTEQLPGNGTSRFTRKITLDDVRVLVDPHDEHGGMIAVPPSIRPRRLPRAQPGIEVVLDAVYNRRQQKTWPTSMRVEVRTAIELLLDAQGISRLLVLEKKMSIASAKRGRERTRADGGGGASSTDAELSWLAAYKARAAAQPTRPHLPVRTRLGVALNVERFHLEVHGQNQQGVVVEFNGETIEGQRRAGIGIGAQIEYLPLVGWHTPTLEVLCDVTGCGVRLSEHCTEAGAPLIMLTSSRGLPGVAIRWCSDAPLPEGIRRSPSLKWMFVAPSARIEGLAFVVQDLSLQMPPRRVLPLMELFVDCTIESSRVTYADVLFEDSRRVQMRNVVDDVTSLISANRFRADIGNVSVLLPLSTLPTGDEKGTEATAGIDLHDSVILYVQLGSATLTNRWEEATPPAGGGSSEFLSKAAALSACFPLVYSALVSTEAPAATLRWPAQLRLNVHGLSIEASQPGSADAALARVGCIEAALSLARCAGRAVARQDVAVLLTMGAVLGDFSGNGSAPTLLATCYEQVNEWATEALNMVIKEREEKSDVLSAGGNVRPRSGSVLDWPELPESVSASLLDAVVEGAEDAAAEEEGSTVAAEAPSPSHSSPSVAVVPPLKFLLFLRLGPGAMQTWSGTKPNGVTMETWWPMQLPTILLSPSDVVLHNYHSLRMEEEYDPSASAVQSAGALRLQTFERLDRFYMKYAPGKRDKIGNILTKYAGREDELFANLALKYGTASLVESATASPAAAAAAAAAAPAAIATPPAQSPLGGFTDEEDDSGELLGASVAGGEDATDAEVAGAAAAEGVFVHLDLDAASSVAIALSVDEAAQRVVAAEDGEEGGDEARTEDGAVEGGGGEREVSPISQAGGEEEEGSAEVVYAGSSAPPPHPPSRTKKSLTGKRSLRDKLGDAKQKAKLRADNLKSKVSTLRGKQRAKRGMLGAADGGDVEESGGGSAERTSRRERASILKYKLGGKLIKAAEHITRKADEISFDVRDTLAATRTNKSAHGSPSGFSDGEDDEDCDDDAGAGSTAAAAAARKQRELEAAERAAAKVAEVEAARRASDNEQCYRYGVDGLLVDRAVLSWLAAVDDARLSGGSLATVAVAEGGAGATPPPQIAWSSAPSQNFGLVFEAFATMQTSMMKMQNDLAATSAVPATAASSDDDAVEASFQLLQELQQMQTILSHEQVQRRSSEVMLVHCTALIVTQIALDAATAAAASAHETASAISTACDAAFSDSTHSNAGTITVVDAMALIIRGSAELPPPSRDETIERITTPDAVGSLFDAGSPVQHCTLYERVEKESDQDAIDTTSHLIGAFQNRAMADAMRVFCESTTTSPFWATQVKLLLQIVAADHPVDAERHVDEQLDERETPMPTAQPSELQTKGHAHETPLSNRTSFPRSSPPTLPPALPPKPTLPPRPRSHSTTPSDGK